MAVRRQKSDYTIQAVAHALDLLEQFGGEVDELGVTDLAKRLRLHKNNVFRLLATLESRGYIEQNPTTENYRLGTRVLELSQTFQHQAGLLRHSDQILHEIVDAVNETAYIAIIRDGMAVYLNAIEPNQTVRVVSRVGHRLPIFATAVGKAQAAFWGEEERENLLKKEPLRAYTKNTLLDRDQIRRELHKVADQGYAEDVEEYEEGIRCVAVPVFDYTRRVRGSLSVSAPKQRMSEDRIREEIVPALQDAATKLSHQLGYEPVEVVAAGEPRKT